MVNYLYHCDYNLPPLLINWFYKSELLKNETFAYLNSLVLKNKLLKCDTNFNGTVVKNYTTKFKTILICLKPINLTEYQIEQGKHIF